MEGKNEQILSKNNSSPNRNRPDYGRWIRRGWNEKIFMKTIGSLVQFIKELNKIVHKNDHEIEYFYIGHSDYNFKPVPTIYRGKRDNHGRRPIKFVQNEDKIFREIILRTPFDFINERTTMEKLVKMQHYGLPTRILDITSNPLVALFFACEKSNQNDGEVLIFKIPKDVIKYYDSDTVSVLANLSQMPFNFKDECGLLLHKIQDEKPQFQLLFNANTFNQVVAVKVKLSNNRILKQNGAFLLFGINGMKNIQAEVLKEWILKIRIRSNCKIKIRNDLNAIAINNSTLYPELEKQTEYIKKLYS